MVTNICNIDLWQSVKSLLNLEPAQAKKSELGWLGLETNSKSEPGSAQLKSRMDFRAKLVSSLEGSGISKLGSSRARTYIKFQAGLELSYKKSRIRKTKHLSTDADSSTDTKKILLVRQNSSKKKMQDNFSPFMSQSIQIWAISFHYFSQRIPNLKNFGHLTSGSGGKNTFKPYLKKLTNGHTNTQTHRQTFRLIESTGTEGRCFKNSYHPKIWSPKNCVCHTLQNCCDT